jgi:hypothetical protein
MLCRCGHDEDRWADIGPATRAVLGLSESTALGSSLLLVDCKVHAGGRGMSAVTVQLLSTT